MYPRAGRLLGRRRRRGGWPTWARPARSCTSDASCGTSTQTDSANRADELVERRQFGLAPGAQLGEVVPQRPLRRPPPSPRLAGRQRRCRLRTAGAPGSPPRRLLDALLGELTGEPGRLGDRLAARRGDEEEHASTARAAGPSRRRRAGGTRPPSRRRLERTPGRRRARPTRRPCRSPAARVASPR